MFSRYVHDEGRGRMHSHSAFRRALGAAEERRRDHVRSDHRFGRGGTSSGSPASGGTATTGCVLGPTGAVRHVIYIQFDNTHLLRDDPNVPSDIEQMPALLDFMERYGLCSPTTTRRSSPTRPTTC